MVIEIIRLLLKSFKVLTGAGKCFGFLDFKASIRFLVSVVFVPQPAPKRTIGVGNNVRTRHVIWGYIGPIS